MGWIAALALLAGCSNGLKNELHPTGSTTAVSVEKGDALIAVNVLEGSLSRLDVDSGAVEELVLGAEPSRVAPFGDHVLVSLRGERAVAVVDISGPKMKVVKMLPTGAEPYGIVADERAKHFFVAVSQADEVVEYDADFKRVRTISIPDTPTWLALHPSGQHLYAVSARKGRATAVELETGDTRPMEPPTMVRPTDMDDGLTDLDHRWTGDPAISPEGDWLVIPGIHADTTTPVETPTDGEPVENGYGSGGLTIGRINPSVIAFPLDRVGAPDPERDLLGVFLGAELNRGEIARSYPTSVTADPEGSQFVVTMEASNAVLLVDLRPFKGQGMGDRGGAVDMDMSFTSTGEMARPVFPEEAGFTRRPVVALETLAAGPDGVVFLDRDTAWTHQFIDRTLAALPWDAAEDTLNNAAEENFSFPVNRVAKQGTALTTPSLSEEVELGLRLFYGARDARMAAEGAGVSCSTCHFGARDDGFTWTFDKGPRQTPSLAGTVSETFPVTWTDAVDSVAAEAKLTSQLRMGGPGLFDEQANAIQAFVDFGREVDIDRRRLDDAALARGKALFEREDVGCATCHSGPRYTDNDSHPLFGLETVNTPPLTGVAATAPYLHDGSAATLGDVLVLSNAGKMGDTSMLSEAELADLESYLRSL